MMKRRVGSDANNDDYCSRDENSTLDYAPDNVSRM